MVVKTAVVHLLVSLWSARVAGWLSVCEGYTLLLLLAHAHAVQLRPVLVTADALHLRVGFA
ncbi:hypothetical protein [Hymenobacter sp. B1770]|uniref:hypothetical protein n=1 Tax=Hymenobacter sp. B1770 TaxID=1718788 RepID=UPI003CF72940